MKSIRDILQQQTIQELDGLMEPFSGKKLLISLSADGGYEGTLHPLDGRFEEQNCSGKPVEGF